jgi:hypothetical protein
MSRFASMTFMAYGKDSNYRPRARYKIAERDRLELMTAREIIARAVAAQGIPQRTLRIASRAAGAGP